MLRRLLVLLLTVFACTKEETPPAPPVRTPVVEKAAEPKKEPAAIEAPAPPEEEREPPVDDVDPGGEAEPAEMLDPATTAIAVKLVVADSPLLDDAFAEQVASIRAGQIVAVLALGDGTREVEDKRGTPIRVATSIDRGWTVDTYLEDLSYPIDVVVPTKIDDATARPTDIECTGEPRGFVPVLGGKGVYRAISAGRTPRTVVLQAVKKCKSEEFRDGFAIVEVEVAGELLERAAEEHPCRTLLASIEDGKVKKALGPRLPDHPGVCGLVEIQTLADPLFSKAKDVYTIRQKGLQAPETVKQIGSGYLVDGKFVAYPTIAVDLVVHESDHTLVGETFQREGAIEGVRVHLITTKPLALKKVFERAWGDGIETSPFVLEVSDGHMEAVSSDDSCRWDPKKRTFDCHAQN